MFVLIDFPIKISFEICSKQLLTMRNRFLILPKPEKRNFNEFLRFEVNLAKNMPATLATIGNVLVNEYADLATISNVLVKNMSIS